MTDKHTTAQLARELQEATKATHRRIGRLVATLQELQGTGITEDARAKLEAAADEAQADAGRAAQLADQHARDVMDR